MITHTTLCSIQALELVQQGYMNIEQVRRATTEGKLRMTRNQLVGVKCYEDFLEDMSREEVETIGNIIINKFHSMQYPDAEVTIMGSYRRGKPGCGDIDVLITLKDHPHSVPAGALSKLVDGLWDEGHISYHLTYLSGMETGGDASHSNQSIEGCDRTRGLKKMKTPSSYMGVFRSPTVHGKHRRVDIKIYPYSQRPFACLYFTGSAHFNRSMRLWAKQKFNLKLSDRGMFDIITGKQVHASSEREVFKILKIHFKEPSERIYFDDVVPLGSPSQGTCNLQF
jgi:DNA polymerase lambda